VLVVEDDPNIVDLIRSNLAVRGFDTIVSTDACAPAAARDRAAGHHPARPDAAEIDGFELCRQVRERSTVG